MATTKYLDELKKKFYEIKEMGYVPIEKSGRRAIGNLYETLLGKKKIILQDQILKI